MNQYYQSAGIPQQIISPDRYRQPFINSPYRQNDFQVAEPQQLILNQNQSLKNDQVQFKGVPSTANLGTFTKVYPNQQAPEKNVKMENLQFIQQQYQNQILSQNTEIISQYLKDLESNTSLILSQILSYAQGIQYQNQIEELCEFVNSETTNTKQKIIEQLEKSRNKLTESTQTEQRDVNQTMKDLMIKIGDINGQIKRIKENHLLNNEEPVNEYLKSLETNVIQNLYKN